MTRSRRPWALALWLFASACGQPSRLTLDAQPDGFLLSGATCGFSEQLYVDADGDGHGTANVPPILCGSGRVVVGYALSWDDCDDSDPAKFLVYNRDADGDGVGSGQDTICAGAEAPPGYLLETGIPDCDDSNPALSRPYLVDADGDGIPAPNPQVVCGPKTKAPPNTVSIYTDSDPGDCDDADPTVWTLYYQDLDGDGYAASADVSVCGNPNVGPPPGFGLFAAVRPDCDDHRADVHPDAIELWSDGIDSDCDGSIAPYRCPYVDAGPCETAELTVLVDATCGSADLAITAVEAEPICYGVLWKIWIANQGTQPIQEYLLKIESPVGLFTFAIKDPLPPGTQYAYRIPTRLHADGAGRFTMSELEGEVRFSVSAAAADCNPVNDTMWKSGWQNRCLL